MGELAPAPEALACLAIMPPPLLLHFTNLPLEFFIAAEYKVEISG